MKKQNVYKRLQAQYNKLNTRIQKAMKTGQFYAYTQFKQQQLLGRLKRCSLQLKQLGAGVAVVAALGMATPAVGQLPTFIKHEGTASPLHVIGTGTQQVGTKSQPSFVDLDGDGDLDCFALDGAYGYTNLVYYENTGALHAPAYTQQTSPISATTAVMTPLFVDIDADGDQDCFLSGVYSYNHTPKAVRYFENTGTGFTERMGAANPLDTLNSIYSGSARGYLSAGDLDNDQDVDIWFQPNHSHDTITYLKNEGTDQQADFVVQPAYMDVLRFNDTTFLGSQRPIKFRQNIEFWDGDEDGDLDAFTTIYEFNTFKVNYYENTGTVSNPIFSKTPTANTPLDSISDYNLLQRLRLVDLDSDGDMDVVGLRLGTPAPIFYENQDTTIVVGIQDLSAQKQQLTIYPNPAASGIYFERAVTGQLRLHTVAGQLVVQEDLEAAQYVDLSTLDNGIYFLEIQTTKGRIREKIVLQRK